MFRPLLPFAMVMLLGCGCATSNLTPGRPAPDQGDRPGAAAIPPAAALPTDAQPAAADLDCTGAIVCRLGPEPGPFEEVRGSVVAAAGDQATVRLDADSLDAAGVNVDRFVPTERNIYSLAIYSADGYHGELRIEGTIGASVHGSFTPRGDRGVRVGDRAANPSKLRALGSRSVR